VGITVPAKEAVIVVPPFAMVLLPPPQAANRLNADDAINASNIRVT
jgi:hypothetical protein